MASKKLSLEDVCMYLPDELVERHNLEDLPEGVAIAKAMFLLEARQKAGYNEIGYHTTSLAYAPGDNIKPELSQGSYRGKIFFSNKLEQAFTDDNPTHCYKVLVQGSHPDPEDLTGRDWRYTLSPVKVLEEVPMEEVYRAKKQ
ncbi:hypothetical protein D6777_00070 [Candidatus Woesearchaeota archaeon]|nr:MAG: hypothetical protein D6777_00070 [Candidatus Woesearchaeota archaeon]